MQIIFEVFRMENSFQLELRRNSYRWDVFVIISGVRMRPVLRFTLLLPILTTRHYARGREVLKDAFRVVGSFV
jgi:hypothetical protein